jgi:NADPH:quinone reductase-like Zn-dependent oxidoreductase
VRIRIRAFGINRSEVMTRQGLSPNVKFPRTLGIECAGEIDDPSDSTFVKGEKVVAMMGGMGRDFDGGYAEYAVVPVSIVLPIVTELPWEVVGSLPEMLQTAYGSLSVGLDLQRGQTLLVRGGTTSVGIMAVALARDVGATVLATTRQPDRLEFLRSVGADPILDTGSICRDVRRFIPGGADAALELIGATTLADTLQAVRQKGVACFTGMVSHQWAIRDFYPMDYIPNGVRLTAYGGEASDLPAAVLQRVLDRIASGDFPAPARRVYRLEDVPRAHADIEQNRGVGKIVVVNQ